MFCHWLKLKAKNSIATAAAYDRAAESQNKVKQSRLKIYETCVEYLYFSAVIWWLIGAIFYISTQGY